MTKMKSSFPLADPIFKLVPIIKPTNRAKFTSGDVRRLAIAFDFEEEEIEAAENQWLDYSAEDEFVGSVTECWGIEAIESKPSLARLMHAIMSMPHSNANSERVFSLLKKIYTETRSRLEQSTIISLLSVKLNTKTLNLVMLYSPRLNKHQMCTICLMLLRVRIQ